MFTTKPAHFVEVELADFEEYLTWCNDYERTAYVGATVYNFRGGQRFAYVMQCVGAEKVYLDPAILKPS